MEEKRKQSLLRYIAIMFVVAFVLVLISLVGQTRSIGKLSQSSASALQRAEELQNTNRELTEQIRELETQLAEADEHAQALQEENDALTEDVQEKTNEINALQQQIEELEQQMENQMKEGNEQ